jgi:dsDNA-specific endonuclease/ATPase MutS2
VIDTILYYLIPIAIGFIIGIIACGWAGIRDAAKEFGTTIKKYEEKEKEIKQRFAEIKEEKELEIKTMLGQAQKKAQQIINQAIKKEEETDQKWEKAHYALKEAEKALGKILTLKKITKEKNRKHLRNLVTSNVPKARVKAEMIKGNRELIYLEDVYKDIKLDIDEIHIFMPATHIYNVKTNIKKENN